MDGRMTDGRLVLADSEDDVKEDAAFAGDGCVSDIVAGGCVPICTSYMNGSVLTRSFSFQRSNRVLRVFQRRRIDPRLAQSGMTARLQCCP